MFIHYFVPVLQYNCMNYYHGIFHVPKLYKNMQNMFRLYSFSKIKYWQCHRNCRYL